MKRYDNSYVLPDDNVDEPIYLACDVDAYRAETGATIHALQSGIEQRNARVAELQKRLFECESAMLLGHDAAMAKYMEQYPEPIEKPAS